MFNVLLFLLCVVVFVCCAFVVFVSAFVERCEFDCIFVLMGYLRVVWGAFCLW